MEKLTYEQIKALLDSYFYGFPATREVTPDEALEQIRKHFSSKCFTRRGNYTTYWTGDRFTAGLAKANPDHVFDINIDPPYGYCIIDEEEGIAIIQMKENVLSQKMGRIFRSIVNVAHFHICLEDGQAKFDREMITRFPGCFQIDSLAEDPKNTPNWLFTEYDPAEVSGF